MSDEVEPPGPEIPPDYQADVELADDWEELDPPDWITDLDREILALLGNHQILMTPSIIAKNIDRSRSSVSRRLNTLEAGGMVEKVERGHYMISKKGLSRMYEKVPFESPPGREDDRNWYSYRIPTPEQVKVLEQNDKLDWEWEVKD